MNLLHIDSSPLNTASVSRQLTAAIVEQWKQIEPALKITHRDLAAQAPTHLSAEILQINFSKPEDWTPNQRSEAALSDLLMEEFLKAEVLVIGAPMYNFSVPSQLKAWIDRIAQAGKTFRYTENGPVGLAGGKKVIIVSSRGGAYADNPAMDFQEAYLRTVFGFLGITDVTIIRAEGLNMGPEVREKALQLAHDNIAQLHQNAA